MGRKYLFASLLLAIVALLVAAWIANFFGQFGFGTRSGDFDHHFTFRSGSLSISQHGNFMVQGVFWRANHSPDLVPEVRDLSSLSARLRFINNGPEDRRLEVPIFLLITAMIPLVVGSLTEFRFRLWQYFAYTMIVAMALACFLR